MAEIRISDISIKYPVCQVGTSSYTPVRYLMSRTGDALPAVMEPSSDSSTFSAGRKNVAILDLPLTSSRSSHDLKAQKCGGGQELVQGIYEKASSGIRSRRRKGRVFHQDIH